MPTESWQYVRRAAVGIRASTRTWVRTTDANAWTSNSSCEPLLSVRRVPGVLRVSPGGQLGDADTPDPEPEPALHRGPRAAGSTLKAEKLFLGCVHPFSCHKDPGR